MANNYKKMNSRKEKLKKQEAEKFVKQVFDLIHMRLCQNPVAFTREELLQRFAANIVDIFSEDNSYNLRICSVDDKNNITVVLNPQDVWDYFIAYYNASNKEPFIYDLYDVEHRSN
jgi:hypothetical protein